MIYDVLDHVSWYRGISEQLDEALDILTHVDFESLEPGSYQVNDKVYYNVMQPDLHPWEETAWECHREYLDIQYALEQGEKIAVCPIEKVGGWSEYDKEGDFSISKEDAPFVALPMGEGHFAVLFPGDAHRPCWGTGEKKKKVVIKVLA